MFNIMVVDDEDVLVDLLREIIEDLDYCTITALNGNEAWNILLSLTELPILIITDRMMPQLNGIEFIRRLKGHPRFRYIPTILMSAAGDDGKASLADVFIQKPFDIDELTDLIDEIINNRRARSA
jgi:CheY-like chemotaxis protein